MSLNRFGAREKLWENQPAAKYFSASYSSSCGFCLSLPVSCTPNKCILNANRYHSHRAACKLMHPSRTKGKQFRSPFNERYTNLDRV